MNFTANTSTLLFFSTLVVTIGFNATYSVQEDAGVISISVFVLMNSLARDLEVTLSTQDDTARGGFCTTPNLQGLISEGVGLKWLRSSLSHVSKEEPSQL